MIQILLIKITNCGLNNIKISIIDTIRIAKKNFWTDSKFDFYVKNCN